MANFMQIESRENTALNQLKHLVSNVLCVRYYSKQIIAYAHICLCGCDVCFECQNIRIHTFVGVRCFEVASPARAVACQMKQTSGRYTILFWNAAIT